MILIFAMAANAVGVHVIGMHFAYLVAVGFFIRPHTSVDATHIGSMSRYWRFWL